MNFSDLEAEIESLGKLDGVQKKTIGHSVQGRPIYAFHVGVQHAPQIIITGAIHAREWITALLVAELVRIYSETGKVEKAGIWFIPLVNPDGVNIALADDPMWKANARGVDLNVNFDANWGTGVQNVLVEGGANYIGPHPNSEPEVQALVDFTLAVQPKFTVAYHSKGEVIYYGDRELAEIIGQVTGYKPIQSIGSAGGYSDWVMMHTNGRAVTVEVGNDEHDHPIGVDKLNEILQQNVGVPRVLLELL